MKFLKQSTAVVISFGPALDPADGFTLKTGLVSALDNGTTGIKLSKNGGAMTIRHATVTATTYDSYGQYLVTLDTTDTNTLGRLKALFAGNSTVLPTWDDFFVVPANVYDSLTNASVFQKVDIAAVGAVTNNATLLAAMLNCGKIGTVTSTGADATHFQCSDITEATGKHFNKKQVWALTGALAGQCLGVVGDYALVSGQGRFTLSPGTADSTNEVLANGDTVFIL